MRGQENGRTAAGQPQTSGYPLNFEGKPAASEHNQRGFNICTTQREPQKAAKTACDDLDRCRS
jgi:hypothetical protein